MVEWPQVQLGELVDFRNGVNFSQSDEGSGVPILKVKDFAALRRVPVAGLDELDKSKVRIPANQLLYPRDIVLVRSNGNRELVGRALIYEGAPNEMTFSGFCIRVRITEKSADPHFIHYWLRSPLVRAAFTREGGGTAINNLSQGFLSRQLIRLPPIQIQEAIASVLRALDDKIELNWRMNRTLEATARAVFTDWFVDFGPTRAKMNGRPPYLAPEVWALFPDRLNDESKPEGWFSESVYDQASWVNGAAYKNMHFSSDPNALPVVKIAELKNGITKSTRFTNTDLGERYKIRDGELLFSWSGNPDTSIDTFVWTSGEAWLNQHIFAVRSNGKRSQAFLYSLLKQLRSTFAEIARNKQTTGLGHITQQDLIRLKIAIPEKLVQDAFDECVGPLHARLTNNLYESQSLIAIRDFLLPKFMSGEISVADVAKRT